MAAWQSMTVRRAQHAEVVNSRALIKSAAATAVAAVRHETMAE